MPGMVRKYLFPFLFFFEVVDNPQDIYLVRVSSFGGLLGPRFMVVVTGAAMGGRGRASTPPLFSKYRLKKIIKQWNPRLKYGTI